MGAKREEVMQPAEKGKTAYHEAGHTLAAGCFCQVHSESTRSRLFRVVCL